MGRRQKRSRGSYQGSIEQIARELGAYDKLIEGVRRFSDNTSEQNLDVELADLGLGDASTEPPPSQRADDILAKLLYLPVYTNYNLGRVGGYAHCSGEMRISLHPSLKDFEGQHEAVFLHEVAHLVCRLAGHKRAMHNSIWKKAMRCLGELPTRCHDMPLIKMSKTAALDNELSELGL